MNRQWRKLKLCLQSDETGKADFIRANLPGADLTSLAAEWKRSK
jgi:hypothetical protein